MIVNGSECSVLTAPCCCRHMPHIAAQVGHSCSLEQENVSQQPSSFMPEVCQIRSIVPVPPYFPKVHTMLVMSDVEKGQRNTRGVDFSVQGLVDLTHIFRILEVLCSISLITFIPGYFDCSL